MEAVVATENNAATTSAALPGLNLQLIDDVFDPSYFAGNALNMLDLIRRPDVASERDDANFGIDVDPKQA